MINQHSKSVLWTSLRAASPIIFGYFPIGMAFGVYAVSTGLAWYWPPLIALIQYSGAGQFFLVALLAANTPATVTLTTLLILNMRHIFYGLPFLDALPKGKIQRLLAIFWLTDEVYSVLTSRPKDQRPPVHLVGMWSYLAWCSGCLLGGLLGENIAVPQASLSFSLTALFVILVIEQVKAHRTMLPIALAIVVWAPLALWANAVTMTLGTQLLILLPMLMLVFAVLHWVLPRSTPASESTASMEASRHD